MATDFWFNAAVTVDLVVLTLHEGSLSVLVVERGTEPYAGRLALPGGFVLPEEDLDDAASRELAEETGVDGIAAHLEQLTTYGTPGRDPRGRVISTAYLALVADPPVPQAGSDAAAVAWRPVTELLDAPGALAFDHAAILADGVERARAKLEYTPLATAFCRPEFTIAELRLVYETVWGEPLDPRNFHRKVTGATDFLEPLEATSSDGGGRPARLYRAGTATQLHPPMLRSRSTQVRYS